MAGYILGALLGREGLRPVEDGVSQGGSHRKDGPDCVSTPQPRIEKEVQTGPVTTKAGRLSEALVSASLSHWAP